MSGWIRRELQHLASTFGVTKMRLQQGQSLDIGWYAWCSHLSLRKSEG